MTANRWAMPAERCRSLQLQLGPPPVSPLSVVPNFIACPHTDPLRDRSVLLQLFSKLELDLQDRKSVV